MWSESSLSRVYPNLFILLVAPPGVGKSAGMYWGRQVAKATKKLKLAPDDMTKAALIDTLSKAKQTKVYPPRDMLEYHSLTIFADELGVFLPAHDTSFLSVMNKLFDNPDDYDESRRGRETDHTLVNPQANLIAGTQPDFLASLLPPTAWGMGFMSRMLMVYAGKSPRPKLFGKRVKIDTRDLVEDLRAISELHGELDWSEGAENELTSWHESGMAPEPQHSKLKHYLPRRILTMLKLCIISSVSRSNSMLIEKEDVIRAREWLLEIEALMPDIFKDMSGNSDMQLIQDLHYYLWQHYSKTNKAPIHDSMIRRFLSARTPPYNVEHLMKLMVATKVLLPDTSKPIGQFYHPGDHNSLIVE